MQPQNISNQTFSAVVNYVIQAINTYASPILIGMALLVFLYGIFTYMRSADDPEARKEGRNYMIYGIIGIFVMLSVWGFVRILVNSFGGIPFGIPSFQSGAGVQPSNINDFNPTAPSNAV